eukprot:COSAG06_NODE_20320_length_800_cov_0.788873_2_plen_70_part_01
MLCYAAGAVGSAETSRGSGVDEPARASALQVIYSRENQHAASELRRYLYLITAPTLGGGGGGGGLRGGGG